MPGCAAVNCSNSSEKGFLMKIFPTNPSRRLAWVKNMKRDNWIPTKHACLCEVHFTRDMWEKTKVDGKRKLRAHAIPTIFPLTKPQGKRKRLLQRFIPPKQPSLAINEIDNENQCKKSDIGEPLDPGNIEKIIENKIVEPTIEEGKAIIVLPPQKIILPDQIASRVSSSNAPVYIKNSSRLHQLVKTLAFPKHSFICKNSWFKNAEIEINRFNMKLSFAMWQVDKVQSSASNPKEHAIHNKLQEILKVSINSLIQIQKDLGSDFIASINSAKETASCAQKRKLPESSQNPAKRWTPQNSSAPTRIVPGNSTVTSHTNPTTSHTSPETSHTSPATSHTIPATSHTSSKSYLKVRSFGQLQTLSLSDISVPEIVNKTEKDRLKDIKNIAEDKSEYSKDEVYEAEKPQSEIIVDMVTNGVEQIYPVKTLKIEQEDCEYTENSDESEDIKIEYNEISWTGISEGELGNNSEQNGHFSKCKNIVGEVEVKSEPKEYLYGVEEKFLEEG